MIRKIIHIDMDAYYASVEQRDNLSLKGKPVIVGGKPEERGVVCTASYEARKYGVRSAMATARAFKLCPGLILVEPDFHKYKEISDTLISFYKEYTDLVEPLSLDECYLDVTENKLGIQTATEIAEKLRLKIKKELNLTASVGVAPNKLLAKIASDMNKPDGIFIIKPNQINNFIKILDVGKIWGVGKVSGKILKDLNIKTCNDLQKYSIPELVDLFGIFGETLYYFCRGIDERLVDNTYEVKSIGAENTFPVDTSDMATINNELFKQLERVYLRLKEESLKAKTITVKVKYADFIQNTRSKSIGYYTDSYDEIKNTCLELLGKTEIKTKKIRLIGVTLSNFDNKDSMQLMLL
jgi:DNA polymerase IV